MRNPGEYAKAIVAAIVATGGTLTAALLDGHISAIEWATIALAPVVSLGGVYIVPNMPSGVTDQLQALAGTIDALEAKLNAGLTGDSKLIAEQIEAALATLGVGSLPAAPATPTEVVASQTSTVLPTLDDAPPAWLAPAVAGFLPTPGTAVSEPPSVPAQAS